MDLINASNIVHSKLAKLPKCSSTIILVSPILISHNQLKSPPIRLLKELDALNVLLWQPGLQLLLLHDSVPFHVECHWIHKYVPENRNKGKYLELLGR